MITFPFLLGKKPKQQHLIQLLHPIRYQWNIIGVQLNVDYGDIKSVERKEAHSDTNKLNEVLQYWSDGKSCEKSWKKIIFIVDNDPVKNKSIADI